MQFNDTTNKDGIIQQIEFRTNIGDAGITGDSTLLKQFTGQINNAYMRAFSVIMQADGIWTVDDANHGNQPRATTNLVSGQSNYRVLSTAPSTSQDWLEVIGVNIKDSNGNWVKLEYKADKNFSETKQQRDVNGGTPTSFYFEGTQIFLDCEPDYASTNGLEVIFNRAPLLFASTDTTKRPGFASLFHEYLVLKPTYWWEKYKRTGDSEQTKRDIMEMEKDMADFYSNRNKYEPTRLTRQFTGRLK